MAKVQVLDVRRQGAAAWVLVECHEGAVSVGDDFVVARRSDGAVARVGLRIEEVWSPTGASRRVQAPGPAQLRLSGSGAELLEPNVWLESWAAPPTASPEAAWWQEQPYSEQDPALAAGFPRLEVDEPVTLLRVSTAFRALLLIPHWFVVSFVASAVWVTVVIGWFVALVTGRLPGWVAEFQSWYLRYASAVQAYAYLITDRFPPFGPPDRSYPVRPSLPPPRRLNRWSVLLRLPLVLPAAVLNGLLAMGWALASPVIWLVVLVKGRYPRSLLQASAALVRFSLHTNAYANLMTSRYPGRVFRGESPVYDVPAPTATLGTAGAEAARPVSRPNDEPRQLSGGARALVWMFVALGILGWAGYAAGLAATYHPEPSRSEAESRLTAAHDKLAAAEDHYTRDVQRCVRRPVAQPFLCQMAVTDALIRALDQFRADTAGIEYPSDAQADAARLAVAGRRLSAALHDMSYAAGTTDYVLRAERDHYPRRARLFDSAYGRLHDDLEG